MNEVLRCRQPREVPEGHVRAYLLHQVHLLTFFKICTASILRKNSEKQFMTLWIEQLPSIPTEDSTETAAMMKSSLSVVKTLLNGESSSLVTEANLEVSHSRLAKLGGLARRLVCLASNQGIRWLSRMSKSGQGEEGESRLGGVEVIEDEEDEEEGLPDAATAKKLIKEFENVTNTDEIMAQYQLQVKVSFIS